MYSLILALSSMLFKVIFFLPDALGILIVEIGILLGPHGAMVSRSPPGLARHSYNAEDYPAELDPDWKNLPWKLFAIVIAQSMVVGWLQSVSPTLGTLAWLVMCFFAARHADRAGADLQLCRNPEPRQRLERRAHHWLAVPAAVRLPVPAEPGHLHRAGPAAAALQGLHPLPIVNVLIDFKRVMASLLGYAMYQNHEAFGIDLLPGAGLDDEQGPRGPPHPAPDQQDAIDAQVAQLVTAGDMTAAVALAIRSRMRGDEAAAQRRYHRVLALAEGKTATLLHDAQRDTSRCCCVRARAAKLKAFQTCRAKDAQFALQDAPTTLALAKAAWNRRRRERRPGPAARL